MKINEQSIYLGDNGRAYCGEHLGSSARFTGRDLSGQKIYRVTARDAADAKAEGYTIRCENPRCQKEAGQ